MSQRKPPRSRTAARSVEVPQATLLRMRAVVVAIASGATTTTAISLATGFLNRHVLYALGGLYALGLVEKGGTKLTSAGLELAAARAESEGERAAFVAAIRASAVMDRVAPRLLDARQPSRDELKRHLRNVAGLNEGTADHRVGMLLSWRRTLLNPQDRLFREQGMWRRIDIKNFRSIESATVDLAPLHDRRRAERQRQVQLRGRARLRA